MKKSQFKASIKEEILDILEAVTDKDVQAQKAYNAELEKTAKLAKDAGLVDEGNDTDKFQDDGYVNKKDVDDTTDLYVHNDPESMAFEGKVNENIKSNIMQTWDKTDTMMDDLREFILQAKDAGGGDLVREIADALKLMTNYAMGEYKKLGDISLRENEDEDKEPTASQLKGDSISMLGTKLQQITKEMKQVVKKWKDAEGDEKLKLTDRLRELTKIKKELESALS
jgi:hypothetical protein